MMKLPDTCMKESATLGINKDTFRRYFTFIIDEAMMMAVFFRLKGEAVALRKKKLIRELGKSLM